MEAIEKEKIARVVDMLGSGKYSDEEIELQVAAMVMQPMTARRLIDWIPEVFSLVFLPHLADVNLPRIFSVKNVHGEWVEFDIAREPICAEVAKIAIDLYHNGPRDAFKNIVSRGSVFATANNALNAGQKIDGASIGLALMGISAETYLPG